MTTPALLPDFDTRLRSLLPDGWFPRPASNVDAILAAPATVDGQVYALAFYARLQTLIGTATDGLLDIKGADYLGSFLPRLAGESDPVYAARLLANLLPKGSTRVAISNAIEALTGVKPHIVEMWSPGDTGVYDGIWDAAIHWDDQSVTWDTPGMTWDAGGHFIGGCYYGDGKTPMPGAYAGPARYQAFIDTIVPPAKMVGGAPFGFYDRNAYYDSPGTGYFDQGGNFGGRQSVLDAINRLKVEGTLIWVRFGLWVTPPQAP